VHVLSRFSTAARDTFVSHILNPLILIRRDGEVMQQHIRTVVTGGIELAMEKSVFALIRKILGQIP
jgi:hypothetical protein